MQVEFLIGEEVKHSARINMTRDELFSQESYLGSPVSSNSNRLQQTPSTNQKFKIPINVKSGFTGNNNKMRDFDDESDEDSDSEGQESEEFSDENESESFEALEEEEEDEDKYGRGYGGSDSNNNLSFKSDDLDSGSNKKVLRKYKSEFSEYDSFSNTSGIGLGNHKKAKRELTVDEIVKKNDQIMKRKLHAKKLLEEEKRQTIEKILNEDGRKLRERQKKLNEDQAKKEQIQEENYKLSLTKIKLKHNRDGKIYLRFPQGLLLPKVLNQKQTGRAYPQPQHCQVMGCSNEKKYKDPVTKLNYCSVNCYKILQNSMHIS